MVGLGCAGVLPTYNTTSLARQHTWRVGVLVHYNTAALARSNTGQTPPPPVSGSLGLRAANEVGPHLLSETIGKH